MNVLKKVMRGVGKFLKKCRAPIIFLLIIFIIVTIVRYTSNKAKQVLADITVADKDVARVETRDLVESITATGTVESAKTRTLASTIVRDTRITSVNCEVGDHVEEGDVLVTFSYDSINKTISQLQEDIAESRATQAVNDTANTRTYYYSYGTEGMSIRDLQNTINEKQKDLNEACSEYGDQKKKLDDLKAERDRHPEGTDETQTVMTDPVTLQSVYTKKYYDQLIESQENAVATALKAQEQAQLAYDKAVTALEDEVYKGSHTLAGATETYQKNEITSNDATKKLQRELESYKDKLDDYVFTAPISGTVTAVNVEENNSFAGGNLLTIEDCSTLYVSTEIDEYDIPSIQLGQKVSIKTDATRDDELEGVIDEIAEASSASSAVTSAAAASSASASPGQTGNATYKVKVKILTEDKRLKLGMTARLSIVIDEKDGVLTVPYDAVVDKGDGEFVVYTIDEATEKKLEEKKKEKEALQKAGKLGKTGTAATAAETDTLEEDGTKEEKDKPAGYPGTGVGAVPTTEKGTVSQASSNVTYSSEGDSGKIHNMSKTGENGTDSGEAGTDGPDKTGDDTEKKSASENIKEFFRVAYGNVEENGDLITDNQIEVPVEVGMENDYYTQISGKDVREGMLVVVQTTVEADDPWEVMMGL